MTEQEARAIWEQYDSSKYHRYDEMTRFLQAFAALYPSFCRLESVGKSAEGRDVWTVTLTNFATGADTDKPAYHIHGQHHAGEVTASATAVYTIYYLLKNYGTDKAVTELLDTRTVYVSPRLTVDGTEFYFSNPQMLRSTPLLYPNPEEPEGLRPQDMNGDGTILQMRIPHPQGEWKVSDKDPRLMVARRPEDREGTFYKLYTEGIMKQRTESGAIEAAYDGRAITGDPGGPYSRERGFDFNRNYPLNWQPQHRQSGSGRYPFDRPEVRAVGEFWLSHKNIGAAMSYHTRSGMNLRPSPLVGDDKMDAQDLTLFKQIGETCTRITGYPTVSVYEYFTSDYNPDRLDVGSWMEWAYDGLGVQGFEMELWNWPYITGVPYRPFKELKNLPIEKREEEALLQLQWNDRELDGKGFTPWTPFEHPQFGKVEIGGWDPKFVGQNPPEKLLHQEVHKNCLFGIQHALSLPLLRIGEVRVKAVGGNCYSIAVQVVNQGYLPTNVTNVALKVKHTKPVEVSISGNAAIVGGKIKQDLGQIPGRAPGGAAVWGGATSAATEKWAEWVVQGKPGTEVTISVRHDRGGSQTMAVKLEG